MLLKKIIEKKVTLFKEFLLPSSHHLYIVGISVALMAFQTIVTTDDIVYAIPYIPALSSPQKYAIINLSLLLNTYVDKKYGNKGKL